ncbi:unnamed protein product [Spirodela intermedia]|uniref:Uncharacterized protein n=1 Tax=Spirodela intermedia TaxID=51605 RepID=A0A7I8KKF6_SPIIN|nr:unnamed protein product [Spirodela intermedia]
MVMVEETRKGPWTEQEDLRLVCFVGLLGDRRWDAIAKVSGLRRSGKSCRLRWVNYLRPGLKRGRMTPQEERLIVDLHARWGNRWSRIAKRLPGRTDNEIKNYWRTRMRKTAQEKGAGTSSPILSSSSSDSPGEEDSHELHGGGGGAPVTPLDQTWNETAPLGRSESTFKEPWCYSGDSLWKIDDDDSDFGLAVPTVDFPAPATTMEGNPNPIRFPLRGYSS